MKKLIIGLLLTTFALLLVSGGLYWLLRSPVPSADSIVGLYVGTHEGYRDQVEIMPDHKFVQTLEKPNGGIITNNGTWSLKNRGLDIGDYSFFIDTETGKALTEPVKYSLFPFTVYPDALINEWSSGYYKLTKH